MDKNSTKTAGEINMKKLVTVLILSMSLFAITFLQAMRNEESVEEFNIQQLPNTILPEICQNLSLQDLRNFEQTCSQFRNAGQGRPVYLKTDDPYLQHPKFESLLQFLGNHKNIDRLDFFNTFITDNQLFRVLNAIAISRANMEIGTADGELKEIPQLKILKLSTCPNLFCTKLRDYPIECHMKLEVLDLSVTKITNEQLASILKKTGKTLTKLNLNNCYNLFTATNPHQCQSTQKTISSIIKYCKNLKELHLYGTNITKEQLDLILKEIEDTLDFLDIRECRIDILEDVPKILEKYKHITIKSNLD